MPARDSFASHHVPAPRPLDRERATNDPLLLAELAALLAKAEQTDGLFGSRIQMLWDACVEAGIAVPGVDALALGCPAPPQAAVLIGYLVDTLPADARLAQAVRVAIFRYKELRDLLARVRVALKRGAAAPVLAEQLRQKLFLLGHYYEGFQADPVLKTLFPAPKVVATGTARLTVLPPPLPADDGKAAREAAIARARAQLQAVAPGMARIRRVLGLVEGGPALKLADLLSPEARATRLLALALPGAPAALGRLRDAEALRGRLEGAIASLERGGPPDLVRDLGERLAALPLAFRGDPLLKELFPAA